MADVKLKINGKEYPVPTSFTLGELADMEDITGQGYDLAKPGAKGILALAYVALRRVDRTVTLDDLRSLDPDQIQEVGGDAHPPSETQPTPDERNGSEPTSSDNSSSGSEPHPDEDREPTGTPV